jgi:hypothetical protein
LKVPTGRPDDPSVGARIFLPVQVSEAASALAATGAPEQSISTLRLTNLQLPSTTPSKDSIGSTTTVIPAEERLSNPDVFLAPHRSVRSRLAMAGGLVGLISAIALTAFIAIGQLPLADIWRRLTVERAIELPSSWARPAPATPPMGAELATPRLVVHRRVVSGEPAALGLTVQGGAASAVIIRGLLPGMELSNGDPVAADASQVAATALGKTWIAPPESFIGSANLIAELLLPDSKIADRLAIQLDWGPPTSPEPTQGSSDRGPPISSASAPLQLDGQQIVAGPPISPEPTQDPSDREEPGPPISTTSAPLQLDGQQIVAGPPISPEPTQGPSDRAEPGPPISTTSAPPQLDRQQIVAAPETTQGPSDRKEPRPPSSTVPAPRQVDGEEIAVLLKRGKDLIATGDLAAARLVLQRAADANDVEATLALAATYDPYVLRELRVYSFAADAGKARTWYEKARQLGSSAALRRLEMLTSGAR